jgi:DNA-nicking Smr family endonuclease
MKFKSSLSIEDTELFHSYIKDHKISPISHDRMAFQPKIILKAKKFIANELDLELTDSFEDLAPKSQLFFARSGLQATKLRKFRSGQYPIEQKLDLHGFTLSQAKVKLTNFLVKCQKNNIRCALIIHGSGKHSADNKAVLKSAVNAWLQQYAYTLAFASAKPVDGGVGAVYLLLKKQHEE